MGSTLALLITGDRGRLLVRLLGHLRLPKTSLIRCANEPYLCVHEDSVIGQGQQDLIGLIAQRHQASPLSSSLLDLDPELACGMCYALTSSAGPCMRETHTSHAYKRVVSRYQAT